MGSDPFFLPFFVWDEKGGGQSPLSPLTTRSVVKGVGYSDLLYIVFNDGVLRKNGVRPLFFALFCLERKKGGQSPLSPLTTRSVVKGVGYSDLLYVVFNDGVLNCVNDNRVALNGEPLAKQF